MGLQFIVRVALQIILFSLVLVPLRSQWSPPTGDNSLALVDFFPGIGESQHFVGYHGKVFWAYGCDRRFPHVTWLDSSDVQLLGISGHDFYIRIKNPGSSLDGRAFALEIGISVDETGRHQYPSVGFGDARPTDHIPLDLRDGQNYEPSENCLGTMVTLSSLFTPRPEGSGVIGPRLTWILTRGDPYPSIWLDKAPGEVLFNGVDAKYLYITTNGPKRYKVDYFGKVTPLQELPDGLTGGIDEISRRNKVQEESLAKSRTESDSFRVRDNERKAAETAQAISAITKYIKPNGLSFKINGVSLPGFKYMTTDAVRKTLGKPDWDDEFLQLVIDQSHGRLAKGKVPSQPGRTAIIAVTQTPQLGR